MPGLYKLVFEPSSPHEEVEPYLTTGQATINFPYGHRDNPGWLLDSRP